MSKDVGHESSQSQASGIRTKKVPQLKALAQIRFVSIGVFEKLLAEIIGKLPLVGEQNLLEPKNVLEAGIVDLSGGINRCTLLKVTLRTILKSASMGLLDPILITPFSRGIKALQCEAIPVDTLVAGVASLVAFVLIDLFLERDGFSVFRFQGRNALRRW